MYLNYLLLFLSFCVFRCRWVCIKPWVHSDM